MCLIILRYDDLVCSSSRPRISYARARAWVVCVGMEYGAGDNLGGSGEVIQRARRKSDSKQSYEKNELSERFLNVRQPLTFSLRAMGVRDRV